MKDVSYNNRKAIVIGNSKYSHPRGLIKLSSCKNDILGIKKVLKKLGFHVIVVYNKDIKVIKKKILKFLESLEKNDVSLFYFTGHGVKVNGRTYLTAHNSDVDNLKETTLCIDKYINSLKKRKTSLDLIFLDCCRNELKKYFKQFKEEIHLKAKRNMLIGFSTSDDSTAQCGDENCPSIFTKYLIEAMQIENISIEQMMKRVITFVTEETDFEQIPWVSFSSTVNFYFKKD